VPFATAIRAAATIGRNAAVAHVFGLDLAAFQRGDVARGPHHSADQLPVKHLC
jgi:hypothetical protein